LLPLLEFIYQTGRGFYNNSRPINTNIIIMKTGTVKFFNELKGFGFIKDDESENEYFVHATGLIDQVREGDEVSFELQEGRRGLNAANVKLA
jgi:cold shock protein